MKSTAGPFTVRFRYTRHYVARGARADAETFDKIFLIKNVSMLRATYQIKLLGFKAHETKKRLVLNVPRSCVFDRSLNELITHAPKLFVREDL